MKVNRELNRMFRVGRQTDNVLFQQNEDSSVLVWSFALLILVVLFLTLVSPANATEIDLTKIAMIESSGNPSAHNKSDDSRGLYQLRKIAVDDYNQFHTAKVDFDEVWDPAVNEQVARWMFEVRIPMFIKHYKLNDDLLTVLAIYNWGIGNVVRWHKSGSLFSKLPLVTQRYYEKYNR